MKTLSFTNRQHGLSLPFALVALAGLGLTGVSMMRSTDATTMIAGNLGFRDTAAKATDLGLEAGIQGLIAMSAADRQSNLTASNYYASLESVNSAPSVTRLSATLPTTQVQTNAATGNTVRYVIERLCEGAGASNASTCVMDAPGTGALYRITAMTVGPRNASQTAQVIVGLDLPAPYCSMMMQAAVVVSGMNTQLGSSKCYHSNTSILISGAAGNAGIEATSVGTTSYGGGGSYSIATQSLQPARSLPPVNPIDHKPYVTHIFTASGTRSNIGGTTAVAAGHWLWQPSATPPQWQLNVDYDSTCPPAGRYYFETNVEISKKIGASGLVCPLSIIAEKSLKINGGPIYMSNYRGNPPATVPAATNEVFLMAGGDLELPGSSTLTDGTYKSALVSAKAEIKVNGAITIEGAIVARNETAAAGSDDLAPINTVSGTVEQTYEGNAAAGATPTAKRKSWRFVSR